MSNFIKNSEACAKTKENKMLIEDRKPKGDVKDSSYMRVCGNERIADLMRKFHSTSIANGLELERLIFKFSKHPNTLRGQKLSDFDLSQKDAFVVQMKIDLATSKNIALDCFLATPNEIYVFEVKDGMNFCTKGSEGEISSLKKTVSFLRGRDPLSRPVIPKIVFWNCEDLSSASFKCKEGTPMLMLGREFARLVGIDKIKIDELRLLDQEANEKFFKADAKKILEGV